MLTSFLLLIPSVIFFLLYLCTFSGFPRGISGTESACQCRRCKRAGFDLWVGKTPWRREWQPTPVFLPGKSHGERSPAGCGPWGHNESARLSMHASTCTFSPVRKIVQSLTLSRWYFFNWSNIVILCHILPFCPHILPFRDSDTAFPHPFPPSQRLRLTGRTNLEIHSLILALIAPGRSRMNLLNE